MMNRFVALAAAGVLLFQPAFGQESGVKVVANAAVEARVAEIRQLIADKNFKESDKQIDAWIKENKKADAPYALKAEIAFVKKSYKKTLSYGTKALDRNSENGWAYFWRARAYEEMKDWMESANEYRAALLIRPDWADATDGLNRVLGNLSVPQNEARQSGATTQP